MATDQAEEIQAATRPRMAGLAPARFAAGRFAGLRAVDGRSIITVGLPGRPDAEVTLVGTPDARLARSLTTGFRRLAWVRIDASGPRVRCEVSGIARRPHQCRLPLAAALALAAADVPTLVRLPAVGT